MKANLFYNHRLGDVLLISFDHNQEMTHFVKNNDTVIIYHKNQIIGVNIFNISSIS